jgi:hypothetical protein
MKLTTLLALFVAFIVLLTTPLTTASQYHPWQKRVCGSLKIDIPNPFAAPYIHNTRPIYTDEGCKPISRNYTHVEVNKQCWCSLDN